MTGLINATTESTRRPRRWLVSPPPPPHFEAELADAGFSAIIARLLYNRGLTTLPQVESFFKADFTQLADPYLMTDMTKAVARINTALNTNETIAIYGDYDTDGVTACSLLVQYFRSMGVAVVPRIPHRVDEGYGLNPAALGRLQQQGVTLVITVDCGISNLAEVDFAASLGMDVIITDHHRPPPVLPAACAILNVRQPGDIYPYKGLAGVGVAYQLVRALSIAGIKNGSLKPFDLLDLVALGTVADVAPLTGENRILVNSGLKALNRTERPGILALLDIAGLKQGQLNAGSIGFGLAPRLNAAGRIDSAASAYQLLLTEDLAEARQLAANLNRQNTDRRQLMGNALQEAREQVYSLQLHQQHRLILLSSTNWAAGIVGLVAGRLCEEFNRPALVLEASETESKGSARSTLDFNVIDAISECSDILLRFGGHRQAAGFTIANQNLPEFTRRMQALADQSLTDEMLLPRLEIDAELELSAIESTFYEIRALAPFGSENTEPRFVAYNVPLSEVQTMGADASHLRLKLQDDANKPIKAVAWRRGIEATDLVPVKHLDIVYTLHENEWQGNKSVEIWLEDFRPAQP